MTRWVEWPYRFAGWLGDGLPWAYRAVILGLHVLNGGLLWLVMRRWLSVTAGFVALTLFWLHPLPWQAVGSITGGREVLLTSYVLLAAVGILSRRWWGVLLAVGGLVAAVSLKTSALALLVVAPVLWASLYGYGRLTALLVAIVGLSASIPWAVDAEPVRTWALSVWRYLAFVPVPYGFSVLHDWRVVPEARGALLVGLTAAMGVIAWRSQARWPWWVWVWVVGLTLPRALVREAPPLTEAQMYLPALAIWIGIGAVVDAMKETRNYGHG